MSEQFREGQPSWWRTVEPLERRLDEAERLLVAARTLVSPTLGPITMNATDWQNQVRAFLFLDTKGGPA